MGVRRNWVKIWASLSIAILGCAGSVALGQNAAQQPVGAKAQGFTIATYNINYGNVDLKAVVETLRKANADIVALQETNRESAAYLRKALANSYPYAAFHEVGNGAGGLAILSKTPLERAKYTPSTTGGWFGTQTARVVLGDRELLVVNVHLTATVPLLAKNVKELVELALKTEATRKKEIRGIVGQVPKRWPTIVLGDFNSIPLLSGAPGFMKGNGFEDSIGAVVENADQKATWHWRLKGEAYRGRLDYIFATRMGAKAKSGQIIESEASDHYLVTCEYEWTEMPVTLGEASAQARCVAYIVDGTGMTLERLKAAGEMVRKSLAELKDEQYVWVVVRGKDGLAPTEPMAATEANRTTAAEGLPIEAPTEGEFERGLKKAMETMKEEAGPKAVMIVSDRIGKEAKLAKTVETLRTDKRVQIYVVDGEGKRVP